MKGHELAAYAVLAACALLGSLHCVTHAARKIKRALTRRANKRQEPKL